jgi:molybdenum cofactor cytidylyltransferase
MRDVTAVVLAAGLSQRMGEFKTLMPWGKTSVVGRVVEELRGSGVVDKIIVVTGHRADEVRRELEKCEVAFAHNQEYEKGGMLSSIKVGMGAAKKLNPPAVVLALVDQPGVARATISALVAKWRESASRVVVPAHGGKRGHPVVISLDAVQEILGLSGDETLKTFMDCCRQRGELLELGVDDSAVLDDLDTPEEYRRALERFNRL